MKKTLLLLFFFVTIFTSFTGSLYASTKEEFITNLYERILERIPSQQEKNYWLNEIDKGRSAAFIIKYFFRSEEFEKHNYSNEEFITKLYKVILERDPDKKGFEYWLKEINEKKRFKDYIFYKFLFSLEFENTIKEKYNLTPFNQRDKLEAFIERFYNILFERRADEQGVEYWEKELIEKKKTVAQIANFFFFSKEFKEKNYSDEKFIQLAYLTLLNREADEGGFKFWQSFLRNEGKKEEMIKSFLASEEFANLLKQYGLSSLNGEIPDFARPVGIIKTTPKDYGSWGNYKAAKKSVKGNYGKDITIFYPQNGKKVPVIFFIPGWYDNSSQSYKKYESLLNFTASKGYAIVFIPYQKSYQLYMEIRDGMRLAGEKFKDIIDLSKVGITGFSSGGGVSISLGYYFFEKKKWGEKGRFLFLLSPWYDFGMEEYEDKGEYLLSHYPKNTQMILQRYDRDEDDPRIVIDFYKNISIPNDEKDFILVNSSPNYPALHTIPYSPKYGTDALDYFVIFRFLDALSDYSFNKNPKAKEIALGNGNKKQISLTEGLNDLNITDEPEKILQIKESYKYAFPCSNDINPRADFCYRFVL